MRMELAVLLLFISNIFLIVKVRRLEEDIEVINRDVDQLYDEQGTEFVLNFDDEEDCL